MISWARPERFITLTNAPEDWQVLRQKVRKLRMKLDRDGFGSEWAWTVEQGTQTGMRHVHALQHGRYVPQKLLQERWGAIVDIRAVRGHRGAAQYALKEALRVTGYAMKGTGADLQAHLDLNGGRGVHVSRGFLHGKTTPEVEKLLWPTDPTLDWILVPAGEPLPDRLRMPVATL